MQRYYYVYMATNKRHTVLYTGVTNSIFAREQQHKNKQNRKSFTARYNINKVIHYESFVSIKDAIVREKQIKSWSRRKKEELITKRNPKWIDIIEESLK